MRDLADIAAAKEAELSERFLLAIEMPDTVDAQRLPLEEILNLAAKLKRLHLDRTGASRQIEQEAEQYFLKRLENSNPSLYERYLEAKRPGASKTLKASTFAELSIAFPDTDIKIKYINDRLALNASSDRDFIVQAARDVANRHVRQELDNLRTNVLCREADSSAFQPFLNLLSYVEHVAVGILFERELAKTLAIGYSDRQIDVLFYKCLRLTHEYGSVSFYPSLDDHVGLDRFGGPVSFPAASEMHQLIMMRDMVDAMSRFRLRANVTVVVCDFDLLKFSGYSIPRQQLLQYENQVRRVFEEGKASVALETEYFGGEAFKRRFAAIQASIESGDGAFISPTEFDRIEHDYLLHYSESMMDWTAARNRYYSTRSVSRNIAEGIELSQKETIVFVFDESTVYGGRFNLRTTKKVPVVSLSKLSPEERQRPRMTAAGRQRR